MSKYICAMLYCITNTISYLIKHIDYNIRLLLMSLVCDITLCGSCTFSRHVYSRSYTCIAEKLTNQAEQNVKVCLIGLNPIYSTILRLLVETVIQNTIQEANDDDGDLISRLRYHATSSQHNRKVLGRWTDKASLSRDDILPSWKGSRQAITYTCSESHDPIFLHSGAP